ncbi:hypothetical protein DY000_02025904 [Brassica cretica]|uniref:DUF4283 domain-containing protein n=1 Tax=Brassica cretica TaxID=69181 RepID=A0ABQ7EBT0_BRACR|nr:hypothetical protein DY000_02025904 [Brassica cretica]
MFRPKKKKELSLMEELRELEMLEEGEMVDISEIENDDLIEENSLSVVVRCLNPSAHKVGGLVKALPPIRGLKDRVHGRGVGENRVQFIFQFEQDLHHVLTRGPWFVNGWIVSLDQWSPNPGPYFLKRILFWIRIRGLPIHPLKKQAVESLIGPLGKIEKIELHAKNSSSVEYIRALVWINTEEPLQFRRIARFKSGEVIPTELEYEKLIKICFACKRLMHDQTRCPENTIAYGPPVRGPALGKETQQPENNIRKASHPGSSSRSGHVPSQRSNTLTTPRSTKAPEQRYKEDMKGKRAATATRQVWKQRTSSIASSDIEKRNSRSTENNTTPPPPPLPPSKLKWKQVKRRK